MGDWTRHLGLSQSGNFCFECLGSTFRNFRGLEGLFFPPPGVLDLELGLVGCLSCLGASTVDGFAGLGQCFVDGLGGLGPGLVDCLGSLGPDLIDGLGRLLIDACLVLLGLLLDPLYILLRSSLCLQDALLVSLITAQAWLTT